MKESIDCSHQVPADAGTKTCPEKTPLSPQSPPFPTSGSPLLQSAGAPTTTTVAWLRQKGSPNPCFPSWCGKLRADAEKAQVRGRKKGGQRTGPPSQSSQRPARVARARGRLATELALTAGSRRAPSNSARQPCSQDLLDMTPGAEKLDALGNVAQL